MPRLPRVAGGAALAVVLSSSAGNAAEPAASLCGECSYPGDRRHDGFFLRVDTGIVLRSALVQVTPAAPPFRSRVRGIGQSTEIALGGTPRTGFVIGGTLWATRLDPTFVEAGRVVSPDDDSVKITIARLGPFIDYYPNPKRGFHAQAALTLAAAFESDVKGNPIEPAAIGAAFSSGGGYEWFVSREMSIGFIARITLDRMVRQSRVSDERTLGVSPEVSFAYTYH